MGLMQTIETDWSIIKKDFNGFVSRVLGAVAWLGQEAALLVGWAQKADPAIGAALAAIVRDGEVALESLASTGAGSLSTVIANLAADAETLIANAIQASGLNLMDKAALSAADVATIAAIGQAGRSAVSAGLARALGAIAPVPLTPAAPKPATTTAVPVTGV